MAVVVGSSSSSSVVAVGDKMCWWYSTWWGVGHRWTGSRRKTSSNSSSSSFGKQQVLLSWLMLLVVADAVVVLSCSRRRVQLRRLLLYLLFCCCRHYFGCLPWIRKLISMWGKKKNSPKMPFGSRICRSPAAQRGNLLVREENHSAQYVYSDSLMCNAIFNCSSSSTCIAAAIVHSYPKYTRCLFSASKWPRFVLNLFFGRFSKAPITSETMLPSNLK